MESSQVVAEYPYMPGDVVGGRYRVQRIRSGGIGVVYLALDESDGSPTALKALRPEHAGNREATSAFQREALIWMSLGIHPFVLPCLAFDNIDGTPFILSPWVISDLGHSSLREWLNSGGPTRRQAVQILVQVCLGLEWAAARIPGFVHADLKPENLLLSMLSGTPGFAVKIGDLGLS